jgi:puromycin-sensitive aminopeptidase
MTDASRLPRAVRPLRYDLLIRPDLDASTFSGRVRIALDVLQPSDTIVLHARGLEVDLAPGEAGTLSRVPEHEQLVCTFEEPLAAGPASLDLIFAGEISHGMLGFYRSTFVDATGATRRVGSTQFEAPHARAAFPCFDEPEFKAVFAVTLDVEDGLVALSNGPEIAREPSDAGRVRVRFGDTIAMSTYLVAWVIGPLEVTPPVDAGGVAVRVAHAPGKGHLTQFALDVGAFAIKFFSDYYGIPYPGEKCDFIAIPDFNFGAMENLGCITFRETRLLLDPEQATLDEMSGAALTIVHEVAHMWFGDLVTMKWWNGIWLNEAFATFMEHIGVDAYRAEWRTWDDFAVGRAAALDVDALAHTRTVEYEVNSPADAEGMFDTLTYQKGGSVLRMIERWLGADEFRSGVRDYLDRYQFANTETTDLWDALERATDAPVRRIMDSWIFQPGFPVVRPDRDRIAQRRFVYDSNGGNEVYGVPVLARVHDNGHEETRSLLLEHEPIALDAPDGALVVLNAGGEGFYRVAYPPEWRDRLLDAGVLRPLERFALLDDLWALVLAGEATAEEFLACARRFGGERELVVWRILATRLQSAGRLLEGDALDRYRTVVAGIVAPTLDELGWDVRAADDERIRQLRGVVIAIAGAFAADPAVIGRAREVVERPDALDADVEAASIAVVASHGSVDDFTSFVELSATSDTPQAQLRYLSSLGDFPAEDLVLRSCELALSDQVRAQNSPFVLHRALRNRDHGAAAWAFVRDHWDEIRGRLSGSLVSRVLEGMTWRVDDASFADIPAFLDAHPVPEAARTIAQHIDRLRVHRAAVDRERRRFAATLLGGE